VHQLQGQKVTRSITAETESVSYLRNAKAYELQNCYAIGACNQLPRPAVKAYKAGLLSRAGEYRVGRTGRPYNLFIIKCELDYTWYVTCILCTKFERFVSFSSRVIRHTQTGSNCDFDLWHLWRSVCAIISTKCEVNGPFIRKLWYTCMRCCDLHWWPLDSNLMHHIRDTGHQLWLSKGFCSWVRGRCNP